VKCSGHLTCWSPLSRCSYRFSALHQRACGFARIGPAGSLLSRRAHGGKRVTRAPQPDARVEALREANDAHSPTVVCRLRRKCERLKGSRGRAFLSRANQASLRVFGHRAPFTRSTQHIDPLSVALSPNGGNLEPLLQPLL